MIMLMKLMLLTIVVKVTKKTTTSRSSECKTNITRSTTADDNILDTEVVIPLNT